MNRVAEVIAFEHRDDGPEVRVDTGGDASKTADHFGPAGDDSQPLPGDYAAISSAAGAGREQVTGYHDSLTSSVAGPGEVRRYARNPAGSVVGELWLKNDGTIDLSNLNGWGITITPTGLVTIKGSQVVLDAPDVRVGGSAGRKLALVSDMIAGTAIVGGVPGQVSGSILGPGSAAGKG